MRVQITIFLVILVAILMVNAEAPGAEQDCPMLEARHITSVRVTFAGFGYRDQYDRPMHVNGTWDLPFIKYYPESSCQWRTKTSTGHEISLAVMDARHPQGGSFLLTIAAPSGAVQASGDKPLSADPYGIWRMRPAAGVTVGTAQVSEAISGAPERRAIGPIKFVAADVAHLREEPSAESKSLIRLRVNSPLEVLETRSPWLKVIALGALAGWIREDVVLDRQLTADEAWKRAAASIGEDRFRWLERTVALDPAHKQAWNALRDAYAAAGKKDRAKAVDRLLAGRDSFYIAECMNGTAELRVVYSDGSFTKLGQEKDGQFMTDVLSSFADEITAWPWYAIAPKSAVLLPGTPFPLPAADTPGQTVRLGRCSGELHDGQVLTTAPFMPEQIKAKKGGRYVFENSTGVALDIKESKRKVSWTVLGPDNKPLRKRDGTAATWSRSGDATCSAGALNPGAWYRNRLSGVIYGAINYGWSCCTGEGDSECGSEDGEWLTLIFPAEGIVDSLYIFKGGC